MSAVQPESVPAPPDPQRQQAPRAQARAHPRSLFPPAPEMRASGRSGSAASASLRLTVIDVRLRELLHDVQTFTAGTTPDLMAWLERTFGKQISSRTWSTVQRLLSRM